MAINQFNKPQPQKEESDLDKVLKGLSVAKDVFGVYTDYTKIGEAKAATAADKAYKDKMLGLTEKDDTRKQLEFDQKQANSNKNLIDPNKLDQFDVSKAEGPGRTRAQLPDGTVVFVKAKPPASTINPIEREPKQNQFAAATYATRASKAENVFKKLGEDGFDRADRVTAAKNGLASIVGLEEQGYKKQEQAELDFLSAVLRKESGASISDSERANGAKQYFDRAGDGPELKKQKAENRAAAIAGLQAEGQPAMGRVQQYVGKQEAQSPVSKQEPDLDQLIAEKERRAIRSQGLAGALPGKKK